MLSPALHDRFPALRATLPHVSLGEGPTPVRRLRAVDGAEVWCKEDGRYGGPYGGNKVRKLEWALADARRRGSRTVLTIGALATNHGLATATYARELGLRTALVLVDQPLDDHVRAQLARLRASGATLHFTRSGPRTVAALPWLMAQHADRRTRRLPYYLPVGGSSPLGVLGYAEAGLELGEQVAAGALPEPAHVVVPVGSGGTLAGLALGLRLAGLRSRAVGVVVNDRMRLDAGRTARAGGAGGSAAALARGGARLGRRRATRRRAARARLPRRRLRPRDGRGHRCGGAAARRRRARTRPRLRRQGDGGAARARATRGAGRRAGAVPRHRRRAQPAIAIGGSGKTSDCGHSLAATAARIALSAVRPPPQEAPP